MKKILMFERQKFDNIHYYNFFFKFKNRYSIIVVFKFKTKKQNF